MISWFRYARWDDVPAWEAKGWAVHADLGLPHSHYAETLPLFGAV